MVFDAHVKNCNLKFGVSELLYRSHMFLYNYQTESLWFQNRSETLTCAADGNPIQIACGNSYELGKLEEEISSHDEDTI